MTILGIVIQEHLNKHSWAFKSQPEGVFLGDGLVRHKQGSKARVFPSTFPEVQFWNAFVFRRFLLPSGFFMHKHLDVLSK